LGIGPDTHYPASWNIHGQESQEKAGAIGQNVALDVNPIQTVNPKSNPKTKVIVSGLPEKA
jgi:hypothetical protein